MSIIHKMIMRGGGDQVKLGGHLPLLEVALGTRCNNCLASLLSLTVVLGNASAFHKTQKWVICTHACVSEFVKNA